MWQAFWHELGKSGLFTEFNVNSEWLKWSRDSQQPIRVTLFQIDATAGPPPPILVVTSSSAENVDLNSTLAEISVRRLKVDVVTFSTVESPKLLSVTEFGSLYSSEKVWNKMAKFYF